MELTMFERLLQLPLFQGMTLQEIAEVMAYVRLDFVNYESGDDIVMQDEPCKNLVYIISGSVTSKYQDPQKRFTLTEPLPKLRTIEPYNMFGMFQKYSRTYSFNTPGTTLTVDRQVMVQQLMKNHIVKINIMNLLCNRYQQALKVMRTLPEDTVGEKIYKFLMCHAAEQKGEKELAIKMTDLADIIHETRLNVSKTLNLMQDKGLAELKRGIIFFPEAESLPPNLPPKGRR